MNWGKALRFSSTAISMYRDPNVQLLARGAWGGMKRLGQIVAHKRPDSEPTQDMSRERKTGKRHNNKVRTSSKTSRKKR